MNNNKRTTTKPINGTNGQKLTPTTQQPASQRVISPCCTSCKWMDTYIYATRGSVRYCKCRRCGHTWSHATVTVAASIQTR